MRQRFRAHLAVGLAVATAATGLVPALVNSPAAAVSLTTTLVSADASGTPGGGTSRDATVSDDGRFVAFLSNLANLVPGGPTDTANHLYRKDRQTGAIEWVDEALGVGAFVAEPVISGDGQHIAFWAQAADTTAAIRRWSAATGVITTVVVNPPIHRIAISDDGQEVLFIVDRPALDPLGASGQQAYLWDGVTTRLVSRSADGSAGADQPLQSVALSGDGSTAVVQTMATNLVAGLGPVGGALHLYRIDLSTGATTLVDATVPGGTQPPAGSAHLRGRNPVSDDGRTIAFTTTAAIDQLIPGTTDVSGGGGGFGSDDTLVLDLDTGYRLLSRSAASATTTCTGDFSGASLAASVDDAGDTAIFSASCEELRANIGGRGTDLFRLDLTDPISVPEHISTRADGSPVADTGGGAEALPSLDPGTSGDGHVVTYISFRALIVPEDTNNRTDAFSIDIGSPGPDVDGDGFSPPDDCDDNDPAAHPGAIDDPTDLIDQDCDGFLDEVTIPATGSPVQLGSPFADDVSYALLVDGTFVIGGPGLGDAEYAFTPSNTGVLDNCFDNPGDTDLGVGFDISLASSVKPPDWGPFDPDHTYEIGYVGTGNHPAIQINDCGHGDNSGSLRLRTRLAAAQPKRDAAAATGGLPVDIDVLANDEGDFDPTSLALVEGDGTATLAEGPVIRYTAPDDFSGPATITYSITGSDGVAVATTVAVTVAPAATGLDLEWTDGPSLPLAQPTDVTLDAFNSTGSTLPTQQISVRSDTTGADIASVAGIDSTWSCGDLVGGVVTCDRSFALEDDSSAPALDVTVTIDPGAELVPCGAADTNPPCIHLVAWNGTAGDEPTASPAPEVADIPVATRRVTASIDGPDPVQKDQPDTWAIDVSNPGTSATFDDPVIGVFMDGGGGVFVGADSIDPAWSCAGASTSTARCTYTGPLGPGDTLPSLGVTFDVGAGQGDCSPGEGPCVNLIVLGEDGVLADPSVVLASFEATVIDTALPPDLTTALSHSTPVRAGGTALFVGRVSNIGSGPTTTEVEVTVELPSGMTPTAAAGAGWACSIDGGAATVTCTRPGPLEDDAIAPLLRVRADVAPSAAHGTAAIEASTSLDADPANDRAEIDVPVQPEPLGPDGAGALGLDLDGPATISEGQTVRFTANIANNGDEDTSGPTTFTVLLPDGLPGGQHLTAEVDADGWHCRDTRLRGTLELRCTHPDGVARDTEDLEVPVDVTAVELAPGGTVRLPFQVVPGGDSARAVAVLTAVAKGRAHLTAAFSSPTLRPGKGGDVTAVVTNRGDGATTKPLQLEVSAPAGISIVSGLGTGWTCVVTPTKASCENPIPLKPEQSTEALLLGLSIDTTTPGATYVLTARLLTADAGGALEAIQTGLLVVEAPLPAGLSLRRDVIAPTPGQPATDTDGRATYNVVLQNTGPTPMVGDVEVVERAPRGTTINGTGVGWTCASAAASLTCTRAGSSLSGGSLSPGATAPSIRVDLDLAVTTAGTSQSVLGTARVGKAASATSTLGLLVPDAPPLVPQPTIAAHLSPSTLTRGAESTLVVELGNAGRAAQPVGLIVGAVLPAGSTGVTAGGTGVACTSDVASENDAVVCSLVGPLAPGGLRTITIAFTLATNAPDQVAAHAGTIAGPAGTALGRLVAQGERPLTDRATDRRAVTSVIADAGDPREVFDLIEQVDGALAATQVSLDGTASAGGDDLSFTWVQTAGPAVTWTDPTGTRTASDGSSVPTASGARPSFVAPRIKDGEHASLSFALEVRGGAATSTDTTTITVVPFPNRAPRIDALTLARGDPSVTPPDGTEMAFTATATDPDGDKLSYSWSYTRASTSTAMKATSDPTRAALAWPRGADLLVVEVVVSDGRNGQASRQLTIGTPPPALAITIDTPTTPLGPITGEAPAGQEVTVQAQVAGAEPADVTWRWTQVRGPALDPVLFHTTLDPSLVFNAPAGAFPGDAVVLRVAGTRGSGPEAVVASAEVTIELQPLPPPAVVILGPTQSSANVPATLIATPSGLAPFTFQWQALGAVGLVSATNGPNVTYLAPTPAAGIVTVTVTDKVGRTATSLVTVVVGDAFTPSAADPSCADASTLAGRAFDAAAGDGFLAGTFGRVVFDLGDLHVTSPCGSASPRLSVADATISIAGGALTGTNLSGSITEDELCIDDGDLRFPEAWGLTAVHLGTAEAVCLDFDPGSATPLTGSLATTGLPFLPMPAGVDAPETTLSFDGTSLRLTTAFVLPTGGAVLGELVIDLASATGEFAASVDVADLAVFGQTIDLTGSINGSAAGIDDAAVTGSLPGPLTLLPGTEVSDISIAWTLGGLTIEGEANVGGVLDLELAGLFVDAENWSLTARGQAGASLAPLPNLTIDPSGFSGTVRSVAGDIEFDVRLAVSGVWSPVDVLTVEQLTAQLSSFPAPSDCVGVGADEVWLAVGGAATLELGPPPIEVAAQACVGFDSGAWSLSSTATFGSWRPVAGIDVAVQDLGILVSDTGSGITIEAQGRVLAFGVQLGARVVVKPADLSIVVDGFGDLSTAGLGLPPGSTGHIVLASADVPDFRFDDPVLDGVTGVEAGLAMYAGFAPDPALGGFMSDVLGLPPITALVVSAQLSGTDITLKAAISVGGGGIPLFEVCGSAPCTPEQLTSLHLTELSLSISLTGRIGFAAESRLHLPASPDGQVPESNLSLTAEIAIDLAGPAITLALFTSDGTWNGALGVPGLDLADLAIQGGVNFASPVPVPTVGFGATIVRLPDEWAELIGADPDAQEPMSFVLNISQTAPILALNIGVDDGNVALRPLTAVGQADALEVDYAKLVIAPFGGTVGPYTFSPGLSMGFAAVIMDVPVDVSATISVDPPLIEASVSVGTVSLGGVTVDGVAGLFRIDPSGMLIDLDGSLTIPTGPNVAAHVVVEAGLAGVTADFVGTASDWDLGALIKINEVTLSAHADLPTVGGPATFALGLDADGTILTVPVSLAGTVTMQGPLLRQASLEATVGGFRVGPAGVGVAVNGKGCDNVVGGPGGDGACVRASFDNARTPKVMGSINGEVTVSGIKATISGAIDGTGVAASGSLTIPTVGAFSVSGRLYSGTPTALAGLTDTLPSGAVVSVQNGDLKMKLATASSVELAGFDSSLKVSVGRLGGTSFVGIDGAVQVLGNNVVANAQVSVNGVGQLKFHVEADMTLGVAGYTLTSAHVVIDDVTGVDASGSVNLGDIGTLSIAGGFTPASGVSSATYHLSADATVTLLGLSLAAAVDLEAGDLTIDLNLNGTVFDGGGGNVRLHGEASTSGRFCADTSVNLSIAGTNPTGTLSFCNKSPNRGFKVTLSVHGYTLAEVAITVPNFEISQEFGPYGGSDELKFYSPPIRADLGAAFDFDVEVTISVDDGLTLDGSGGASAYYEIWVNEGSFWEPEWVWTRFTIGSIGITVDEVDRSACGEVSVLGLSGEVCV